MSLKIKEVRLKKKLSVRELSERSGVSMRMINAYEAGTSDPGVSKLLAISIALDTNIYTLLGHEVTNDDIVYISEPKLDYLRSSKYQSDYLNTPISHLNATKYSKLNPDGSLDVPGIKCDYVFPSIVAHMKPTIIEGDLIGVKKYDIHGVFDPDKIYYIVTNSNSMIKHVFKKDDHLILRSISSPEFTLPISDVKAIYLINLIIRHV